MSNTQKLTVKPSDVAEKAKEENLLADVPAQNDGEKAGHSTKEKAKEVIEETAEAAKKTTKDRLSSLVEKAKGNKKFFLGVVTGALSTAVVMTMAAKEKIEDVVELTIADEVDGDSDDNVA